MQTKEAQDVYVGTTLRWEQAKVTVDNDTLTVRIEGTEPMDWVKVLILYELRTLVTAPGGATYEGVVGVTLPVDDAERAGSILRISTRSNDAGCIPCGGRR